MRPVAIKAKEALHTAKASKMLNFSYNFTAPRRHLQKFDGILDEIMADACTRIAFDTMRDAKFEYAEGIDRPKPWTISGVQVQKADKAEGRGNIHAKVFIATDREGRGGDRTYYMKRLIEGGVVTPRRKALAIPSELVQDRYGNLRRGELKRLMNEVKRMRGKGKRAKQARSEREYLIANRAGIFVRYGQSRQLHLLVAFVRKSTYQASLRTMEEIALERIRNTGEKRLAEAARKALRKIRAS